MYNSFIRGILSCQHRRLDAAFTEMIWRIKVISKNNCGRGSDINRQIKYVSHRIHPDFRL